MAIKKAEVERFRLRVSSPIFADQNAEPMRSIVERLNCDHLIIRI